MNMMRLDQGCGAGTGAGRSRGFLGKGAGADPKKIGSRLRLLGKKSKKMGFYHLKVGKLLRFFKN